RIPTRQKLERTLRDAGHAPGPCRTAAYRRRDPVGGDEVFGIGGNPRERPRYEIRNPLRGAYFFLKSSGIPMIVKGGLSSLPRTKRYLEWKRSAMFCRADSTSSTLVFPCTFKPSKEASTTSPVSLLILTRISHSRTKVG